MEPEKAELPTQFPVLQSNDGNLHLQVSIDKSVGKIAAGLMAVIVGAAVMIGLGIALSIWMIIAYQETEREVRLQRLETDEMNVRLELAKIPRHQPGDKP